MNYFGIFLNAILFFIVLIAAAETISITSHELSTVRTAGTYYPQTNAQRFYDNFCQYKGYNMLIEVERSTDGKEVQLTCGNAEPGFNPRTGRNDIVRTYATLFKLKAWDNDGMLTELPNYAR